MIATEVCSFLQWTSFYRVILGIIVVIFLAHTFVTVLPVTLMVEIIMLVLIVLTVRHWNYVLISITSEIPHKFKCNDSDGLVAS